MATATSVSGTNTAVFSTTVVDFNLYPNPTSGNANIEVLDAQTITVMNMNGQVVFESNASKDQTVFNLPCTQWTKGIYIVKVNTLNGVAVKKFVVE